MADHTTLLGTPRQLTVEIRRYDVPFVELCRPIFRSGIISILQRGGTSALIVCQVTAKAFVQRALRGEEKGAGAAPVGFEEEINATAAKNR